MLFCIKGISYPSIYLADTCRVQNRRQNLSELNFFWGANFSIFSWLFGRRQNKFLASDSDFISVRLIGIQSLINIHLLSFKILHQLEIPIFRRTFAPQHKKKGKNDSSKVERCEIYIRKRSPAKCPPQKTARRREKNLFKILLFSMNPTRFIFCQRL